MGSGLAGRRRLPVVGRWPIPNGWSALNGAGEDSWRGCTDLHEGWGDQARGQRGRDGEVGLAGVDRPRGLAAGHAVPAVLAPEAEEAAGVAPALPLDDLLRGPGGSLELGRGERGAPLLPWTAATAPRAGAARGEGAHAGLSPHTVEVPSPAVPPGPATAVPLVRSRELDETPTLRVGTV